MQYIIYDMEWNQPPNEAETVQTPVYLTGEIIQIGAVKLDADFQVAQRLRLYITPRHYTRMHRKIASLTRIRNSELQQGIPFPEACEQFLQWCGEDSCLLSWSLSDLPMLVENMQLHGMDTGNLPLCCDVQRIFAREIMRSDRRFSLEHALEVLGEPAEEAHDALHDAINTAKVCRHLDMEQYIDEYIAAAFALAPCDREFESVSQIRTDPELAQAVCPWCGETVTLEGWVDFCSGEVMAYGTCPQGDEMIAVMEWTRHAPGRYRVKRLFYEVSPDFWEIYSNRSASPV